MRYAYAGRLTFAISKRRTNLAKACTRKPCPEPVSMEDGAMLDQTERSPALQRIVGALQGKPVGSRFHLDAVPLRSVAQQKALKLIKPDSELVYNPQETDHIAVCEPRTTVVAPACT